MVIITLLFLTGINDDVLEKVQRLQFSEIANLVPGTESLSSAITAKKKIKISTMNIFKTDDYPNNDKVNHFLRLSPQKKQIKIPTINM